MMGEQKTLKNFFDMIILLVDLILRFRNNFYVRYEQENVKLYVQHQFS